MNSGLFLRFLQEEYLNLINKQKGAYIMATAWRSVASCGIPPENFNAFIGIEREICFFKKFVMELLKKETIQLHDGSEISASEYFAIMAAEKRKIPPYSPLYPRLISILKLLNENEVAELFGPSYLPQYRRLLSLNDKP